ncbi:MAG: hypothetical protein AB7D29_02810 [Campylobacterales bacterium]
MFVAYTPDEVNELIAAGSKNKKAVVASQEDKLFHSIKHVRLFDDIEMTDTLNIVSGIKINRYKSGDVFEIGDDEKERIYYIISGSLIMPLGEDSHVELGKDQVFGEVSYFTKTPIRKSMHVSQDNTMIFSFKINKNGFTRDNAAAFAKFYEALFVYTANKLLWFEMA